MKHNFVPCPLIRGPWVERQGTVFGFQMKILYQSVVIKTMCGLLDWFVHWW